MTPWPIQSMKFSRPEYWSGYPFPSPGDLANPGIEPRSPALQADSLPTEPQDKPKNTGVGSLSLLQRIFPAQGSNWGLLHCRWILYQLSYQGTTSNTVNQIYSGFKKKKNCDAKGKNKPFLKILLTKELFPESEKECQ